MDLSREAIKQNYEAVMTNVNAALERSHRKKSDVKILLATKTVDVERIKYAVSLGVDAIGENRVQELLEKYDGYKDIGVPIHFIGRLQTNKVKYIVDKVTMIHSVDSVRLAEEIDRQCAKIGKVMDVLVEINIGEEESKGGILPADTEDFLKSVSSLSHIHVCGLMAIPPKWQPDEMNANDEITAPISANSKKIYKISPFLEKMLQLFLDISKKKVDNIDMYELSVGMTDDYAEAILCGSTCVRLGRAIFGSRA